MATIYRTSDRIKVRVDDIVFHLAPLKYSDKATIQSMVMKGTTEAITDAAAHAIKCSVKEVDGIVDGAGEKYSLEFDSEGSLTDDTVSDLLNLQMYDKLIACTMNLLNGVPKKFTNMETGKPIKGVEIVEEPTAKKK